MKVFGREVTAVIVYNPALEAGQLQGSTISKEKTAIKLQELSFTTGSETANRIAEHYELIKQYG